MKTFFYLALANIGVFFASLHESLYAQKCDMVYGNYKAVSYCEELYPEMINAEANKFINQKIGISQDTVEGQRIQKIRKSIENNYPNVNKAFLWTITEKSITYSSKTLSEDTIFQIKAFNDEIWVGFLILFSSSSDDAIILLDHDFQSEDHFSFYGKLEISNSEVYAFEYISISDGMQSYYLYESEFRQLYKASPGYNSCDLDLSSINLKNGKINCELESKKIGLKLTLVNKP
ncbi:MAG: hypothetical protein CL840_16160 [Crocinitomicaceae bacterium]|nr:hypothetical protein [Crocinitomicaceae bacterium]|tara:strand:- start:23536 stop:24234 length:699 start_codon:yes stop_codon:yes gene_type:complete